MSSQESTINYYPYQEKQKFGANASAAVEKEEEKQHKTYPFKCAVCNLSEICHHYGQKPPFARGQIEYVEDTYSMMDPFTAREKGRPNFLTIGGKCGYCQSDVCVDCSVFYAKRICRDCAHLHMDDFPTEVQNKLKKLK